MQVVHHGVDDLLRDLGEDRFLRIEVHVEGALRHVRGGHDVGHPRFEEAAFLEDPASGTQGLVAALAPPWELPGRGPAAPSGMPRG
ncbi:hypothetical protein [Streptomyces chartreusis]|uniref:hypothetical protein n=1 Tax=Streptomyces chartreusis TaxID=1969 RepID=UPI003626804D